MTKQQEIEIVKNIVNEFINLKTSVVGDGQFRNGVITRNKIIKTLKDNDKYLQMFYKWEKMRNNRRIIEGDVEGKVKDKIEEKVEGNYKGKVEGAVEGSKSVGLKRDTIDKFYTKLETVNTCVDLFYLKNNINNNDLIIEPSAGNGSFSEKISEHHYNLKAYDIMPENNKIIKQDFLELDTNTIDDVHFIGNPPFGRQSSLARKFIKHCCNFVNCKSISFILPKSFRTSTYQEAFNDYFHLIHEEALQDNAFTINGEEHSVPCVFQIWVKKDVKREKAEKISEIGYHFVKQPKLEITKYDEKNKPIEKKNIFEEIPDFGILRAGGGKKCGRISDDVFNGIGCYPEAWLFIKLDDNINKEKFVEEYKKIDWSSDTNIGAKSISKQIFIKGINGIVNQCN